MTTLIGEYVTFVLGMSSDPVRIGAQVISGIGFLGAGMIMTRGGLRVKGLTTAAGLWATATIGLALGIGLYSAAIIAVFLVYTTNKVPPIFEKILVLIQGIYTRKSMMLQRLQTISAM